jgi:hypothetical protein
MVNLKKARVMTYGRWRTTTIFVMAQLLVFYHQTLEMLFRR